MNKNILLIASPLLMILAFLMPEVQSVAKTSAAILSIICLSVVIILDDLNNK